MSDFEYLKKYYKGNLDEALLLLDQNIPVQYIVGNVDFLNTNIKVDKRVLIPRFETELLVEKVLYLIKESNNLNILDIGTGSGAIAIAIAKNTNHKVYAIDISQDALDLAKENAILNNVDIKFIKGDIFPKENIKFDVIISNPPYIDEDDSELEDIVYKNEPHLALFAKEKGLYFYKKIIDNIENITNEKYLVAFEFGYKQKKDLENIVSKLSNVKVLFEQDLSKKDRYLFIKKD